MLQTNILLKLSEIRNPKTDRSHLHRRSIRTYSTLEIEVQAPLSSIVSIDRTSVTLASRRGSRKSTSITSEIGTESEKPTENAKSAPLFPIPSSIRNRKSTSVVHLYRRLFESQSTSIVD